MVTGRDRLPNTNSVRSGVGALILENFNDMKQREATSKSPQGSIMCVDVWLSAVVKCLAVLFLVIHLARSS